MNDGNTTQLNFNIPKIKKKVSKDNLRNVSVTSRDAKDILQIIDQRCLDHSYKDQWEVTSVQIVDNPELESSYRKKRIELKEDGRHSRELSEQFCFLGFRQDRPVVNKVIKHGLRTRLLNISPLGDVNSGVYLCRHPDVQLRLCDGRDESKVCLCVFKVTLGKCKSMQVAGLDSTIEPTPNFDSHVSAISAQPSDAPTTQMLRSQVYLFEYTDEALPSERPRHCLPYALVYFKKNLSLPKSSSRPRPSYSRSGETRRSDTDTGSWIGSDPHHYPAADARRANNEAYSDTGKVHAATAAALSHSHRPDARRESFEERNIASNMMYPLPGYPHTQLQGLTMMALTIASQFQADPQALARRGSNDSQQNSEHAQSDATESLVKEPEAKILSPEIQTMINTVNELWGKAPDPGQLQLCPESEFPTLGESDPSDFNYQVSGHPATDASSSQGGLPLGRRDPRMGKTPVPAPDPKLKQKIPEVAGLSTEADIKDLNESIEALNENMQMASKSAAEYQHTTSQSFLGPGLESQIPTKDQIKIQTDINNEKFDSSPPLPVITRSGKKKISLKDYSSRVSVAKKTQVSTDEPSKMEPVLDTKVSDSKTDAAAETTLDKVSEIKYVPQPNVQTNNEEIRVSNIVDKNISEIPVSNAKVKNISEIPVSDTVVNNVAEIQDSDAVEKKVSKMSNKDKDSTSEAVTSVKSKGDNEKISPVDSRPLSMQTSKQAMNVEKTEREAVANNATSAVKEAQNDTHNQTSANSSQRMIRMQSSFESTERTAPFDSPSKADPVTFSSPGRSYKSMFSPDKLPGVSSSDVEQCPKRLHDDSAPVCEAYSTSQHVVNSQDVYRTTSFAGEGLVDQHPQANPSSIQDLVCKLQSIGNLQDVLQKYKFPLPASGTSSQTQLSPTMCKPGPESGSASTAAYHGFDVDMRMQREAFRQHSQGEYTDVDVQGQNTRYQRYHMGYEVSSSQSDISTYTPRSLSPGNDQTEHGFSWRMNARNDKSESSRHSKWRRSSRRSRSPRSPRNPRSPRRRDSWSREEHSVNAYGDVDMRLWRQGSHRSEESSSSRSTSRRRYSPSRSEPRDRDMDHSSHRRMENTSRHDKRSTRRDSDEKNSYSDNRRANEKRTASPDKTNVDLGMWVAPTSVVHEGKLSIEVDYTPRKLLSSVTDVPIEARNLFASFDDVDKQREADNKKDEKDLSSVDDGLSVVKPDTSSGDATVKNTVTEQQSETDVPLTPQKSSITPAAETATTVTTSPRSQTGGMSGAVAALAALWSSQEVANQLTVPEEGEVEKVQETGDSNIDAGKTVEEKTLEPNEVTQITNQTIPQSVPIEPEQPLAVSETEQPLAVSVDKQSAIALKNKETASEMKETEVVDNDSVVMQPKLDHIDTQPGDDGKMESVTTVEKYQLDVTSERSESFQAQWSGFAKDDFPVDKDYTDLSFDMPHQFQETIPDGHDSSDIGSGQNTPVQDEKQEEHDDREYRCPTPLIDEIHDEPFTPAILSAPTIVSSLVTSASAIIHEPLSGFQPLTSHLLANDTLVTTDSSQHFTPIDNPYIGNSAFPKDSTCALASSESAADTAKLSDPHQNINEAAHVETDSDHPSRQGTPVQDEPYLTDYPVQINSSSVLEENKANSDDKFLTTQFSDVDVLHAGKLLFRDKPDITSVGRQSAFTSTAGTGPQSHAKLTESTNSYQQLKEVEKQNTDWPKLSIVDFRKVLELNEKSSCTLCQTAISLTATFFKSNSQCKTKTDPNSKKNKINTQRVERQTLLKPLLGDEDVKPNLVTPDTKPTLGNMSSIRSVPPAVKSTQIKVELPDVRVKDIKTELDENKCLLVKNETDQLEIKKNKAFWRNVAYSPKKRKDSIKKEFANDTKLLSEASPCDVESKIENSSIKDEEIIAEVKKKEVSVKTQETDDIDVIGTHTQRQVPVTVEKKKLSIKFKKEIKKSKESVPYNPMSNIQRISTIGRRYSPTPNVKETVKKMDLPIKVRCISPVVSPSLSGKPLIPAAIQKPIQKAVTVKDLPVQTCPEVIANDSKIEGSLSQKLEAVIAKVSVASDDSTIDTSAHSIPVLGSKKSEKQIPKTAGTKWNDPAIPVYKPTTFQQVPSYTHPSLAQFEGCPIAQAPIIAGNPRFQQQNSSGYLSNVRALYPQHTVIPVHSGTHVQPVQANTFLSQHVNTSSTRLSSVVPIRNAISSAPSLGAFQPGVPSHLSPRMPSQFQPINPNAVPQLHPGLSIDGAHQMMPRNPNVNYVRSFVPYPRIPSTVQHIPTASLVPPQYSGVFHPGPQPTYYTPMSGLPPPQMGRQDQNPVQYAHHYGSMQQASSKSSDLSQWFADIVAPKRETSKSPTISESSESVGSVSSDNRKRETTSDCSPDSPLSKRIRPMLNNLRQIPLEDSGGGTANTSQSDHSQKNNGSFLVLSSRGTSLGDMMCAGKDRKDTDSLSSLQSLEHSSETFGVKRKHSDVETLTNESLKSQKINVNKKICLKEKEIDKSYNRMDDSTAAEIDTTSRSVSICTHVGSTYKSYSLKVEISDINKPSKLLPKSEHTSIKESSSISSSHLSQEQLSQVTIGDLSLARMNILNALNELPASSASDCESPKHLNSKASSAPPANIDIYDPAIPTSDSEEEGELKTDDSDEGKYTEFGEKLKHTFILKEYSKKQTGWDFTSVCQPLKFGQVEEVAHDWAKMLVPRKKRDIVKPQRQIVNYKDPDINLEYKQSPVKKRHVIYKNVISDEEIISRRSDRTRCILKIAGLDGKPSETIKWQPISQKYVSETKIPHSENKRCVVVKSNLEDDESTEKKWHPICWNNKETNVQKSEHRKCVLGTSFDKEPVNKKWQPISWNNISNNETKVEKSENTNCVLGTSSFSKELGTKKWKPISWKDVSDNETRFKKSETRIRVHGSSTSDGKQSTTTKWQPISQHNVSERQILENASCVLETSTSVSKQSATIKWQPISQKDVSERQRSETTRCIIETSVLDGKQSTTNKWKPISQEDVSERESIVERSERTRFAEEAFGGVKDVMTIETFMKDKLNIPDPTKLQKKLPWSLQLDLNSQTRTKRKRIIHKARIIASYNNVEMNNNNNNNNNENKTDDSVDFSCPDSKGPPEIKLEDFSKDKILLELQLVQQCLKKCSVIKENTAEGGNTDQNQLDTELKPSRYNYPLPSHIQPVSYHSRLSSPLSDSMQFNTILKTPDSFNQDYSFQKAEQQNKMINVLHDEIQLTSSNPYGNSTSFPTGRTSRFSENISDGSVRINIREKEALTEVERDLLEALRNQLYIGRSHQKVPNDILLPKEKTKLYTEEGCFLLLLVPISKKPFQRLLDMKISLQKMFKQKLVCASENNTTRVAELIKDIKKVQSQRKTLLTTFTGSLGKKRLRRLNVIKSRYELCINYMVRQYGKKCLDQLLYVQTLNKAIKTHVKIVEKELLSPSI